MTLNDYYIKFGTTALAALAEKSKTKPSYLKSCIYRGRRPSMALAVRLIHASNGLLSYEGLANPSRMLPKHVRAGERLNGTSK